MNLRVMNFYKILWVDNLQDLPLGFKGGELIVSGWMISN